MKFAPLSFLRGPQPPRSTTKHGNSWSYNDSQNRQFTIDYLTPTAEDLFSHRQTFPTPTPDKPYEPSRFHPPPHYHMLQEEYFKVESGKGIWYLDNGRKTVHLVAGDEIRVPKYKWHWFETDPSSTEPFSVLYRYDREYREMEFRYFRNTLSYLADCQAVGEEMSLFQLQVFNMHNFMCLGIVTVGPEWFRFLANTLVTFVQGCIGQFLLGYSSSYPEYYQRRGKKLP